MPSLQIRDMPEDVYAVGPLTSVVLREASARRHAVLARRQGAAAVTIDLRLREMLVAMDIPALP